MKCCAEPVAPFAPESSLLPTFCPPLISLLLILGEEKTMVMSSGGGRFALSLRAHPTLLVPSFPENCPLSFSFFREVLKGPRLSWRREISSGRVTTAEKGSRYKLKIDG